MAKDSPPPETVDEEMTVLQEEFTQLLRERKQRIDELLLAIGETEDADGNLKELNAVVHKLSGSCGMYGYAALGKIARECQQRLLQEGQCLTSNHEVLNRMMGGLLEALRKGIETGPDAAR